MLKRVLQIRSERLTVLMYVETKVPQEEAWTLKSTLVTRLNKSLEIKTDKNTAVETDQELILVGDTISPIHINREIPQVSV